MNFIDDVSEMPDVVLVAVDIRSIHNVGSFFRTCDGFGAGLVLTGITPRPNDNGDDRPPHVRTKLHRDIHKTALGAEDTVKWSYFADSGSALSSLKDSGYQLCAIEQSDDSVDIARLSELNNKVALLVGPEVTGLDSELLEKCDEIYEIPMSGSKESFNVSVAAAIALYEASR